MPTNPMTPKIDTMLPIINEAARNIENFSLFRSTPFPAARSSPVMIRFSSLICSIIIIEPTVMKGRIVTTDEYPTISNPPINHLMTLKELSKSLIY